MGRRLKGALAAAPGGDNRAERPPQPEREPEPSGAELGLSGAGRAGPGGSHGPLGPGLAPRCRHRVAPASLRGYCRCWGCCSAAPPGLPASRRRSPPARRVSLGQEGQRSRACAPPPPFPDRTPPASPLLAALVNRGLFYFLDLGGGARRPGVRPYWGEGSAWAGVSGRYNREDGGLQSPRRRPLLPCFSPSWSARRCCLSHCLPKTPAQGRAGAGAGSAAPCGFLDPDPGWVGAQASAATQGPDGGWAPRAGFDGGKGGGSG